MLVKTKNCEIKIVGEKIRLTFVRFFMRIENLEFAEVWKFVTLLVLNSLKVSD